MTQYHRIVCDLCKEETEKVHGQIAIGKIDVEGKPTDILEVCDKCRQKLIQDFGLTEYKAPEEPQPEAQE